MILLLIMDIPLKDKLVNYKTIVTTLRKDF